MKPGNNFFTTPCDDKPNNAMAKETQSAKSFLSALTEEYECPALLDKKGYFNDWKKNVFGEHMPSGFYKMFANGSGSELKGKAKAIHSSSMLAYNFFHWISKGTPLELFGKKFVDVAFEVKLPCLKRGGYANLDVALLGDDGQSVLFLESKFTEYFSSNQFEISDSYNDSNKYVYNGSSWAKLVRQCVGKYTNKSETGYYDGIKQAISHLVAIDRLRQQDQRSKEALSRYFDAKSLRDDCQFYFATIVFEPKNDELFEKEQGAFTHYRDLFRTFVEIVNHAKDIDHDLFWNPKSDDKLNPSGFLTYGNMWTKSKGAMPIPLRKYLREKYMKHSATPED